MSLRLLIVVSCLLAAWVPVSAGAVPDAVRSLVLGRLTAVAGAPVEAGSMSAEMSGTVTLEDVVVKAAVPVRVARVKLAVDPVALLSGTLRTTAADLDGLRVKLPRGHDVSIQKWAAHLPERVTFTGAEVGVGKVLLEELRGTLEIARGATPRLELADVTARMSAPGSALRGQTRVKLAGEGSLGGVRLRGEADLAGLSVESAGLAQPARIVSGHARLEGKTLTVPDLAVETGGVKLGGRVRATDLSGAAKLDGALSGSLDLAAGSGGRVEGTGRITAAAAGTLAKPRVTVTITSQRAVVTLGGRRLIVTDLRARPSKAGRQIVLEDLSASVAGGRLTGRAVLGGAPELAVDLRGAHLAALGPRAAAIPAGSVDLTFKGTARADGFVGGGRATLHGLRVDLSDSDELRAQRSKLAKGRTGAAVLGVLFGQGAGAGMSEKVAYYDEVLHRLMRPHALGPVRAAFAVDGGRLTLDPLSGPNLAGRARVRLGDGDLLGYLQWVRLAGVRIEGVRFTGTASNPHPHVDPERVQLEGQARADVEEE